MQRSTHQELAIFTAHLMSRLSGREAYTLGSPGIWNVPVSIVSTAFGPSVNSSSLVRANQPESARLSQPEEAESSVTGPRTVRQQNRETVVTQTLRGLSGQRLYRQQTAGSLPTGTAAAPGETFKDMLFFMTQ